MRPSLHPSIQHHLMVVRPLLGILAAVMMLFGQSIAVGAMQSNSGIWIEICGGEGTKLVQTEDETPQKDCTHCEYCTIQFSAPTLGPAPQFLFSTAQSFVPVQFFAAQAEIAPNAAQFWSANRGPPLASEENMNIIPAVMAAIPTPAQWGASWL